MGKYYWGVHPLHRQRQNTAMYDGIDHAYDRKRQELDMPFGKLNHHLFNDLADDIRWSALNLKKNTSQIFAQDTYADQLHTSREQ